MGRMKPARRGEGWPQPRRKKTRPSADVVRVIRHEVNNPLTGILGNAELILAEGAGLPEKTRERLTTIVHLAVRLRDVLRELEERGRGAADPAKPSVASDEGRAAAVARPLGR